MPILINDSPEEIYEKNKHLLCTNPEETIQAGEVMNEAVKLLKYHAITEDDYEFYERDDNNRTINVMASPYINDHNPSNKKYKNEIVKSANLFKTDIDSEEDIKQGQLKKSFVNITGYLIQKYRCVNITYIESIERHSYSFLNALL
ncbi:fam-a protein [Plasmodium yoelii yoelii]|uniref:Fam-a protein n=1 Tax=Plasmodium yoelii yoelii TaxID=73239 RepID=A0AAE9WZV9_PLAYO|nr:fam-a protein [Plasmodium yoelii yoelii]